MIDDLERHEPTPGSDLARFVERARKRGLDAYAVRPKAAAGQRRTPPVILGIGHAVTGAYGNLVEGTGSDGERDKSTEDRIEELPRDGNEQLRERGFEIIPEEELPGGKTTVAFFGAPRSVPRVWERVEVRIGDGS